MNRLQFTPRSPSRRVLLRPRVTARRRHCWASSGLAISYSSAPLQHKSPMTNGTSQYSAEEENSRMDKDVTSLLHFTLHSPMTNPPSFSFPLHSAAVNTRRLAWAPWTKGRFRTTRPSSRVSPETYSQTPSRPVILGTARRSNSHRGNRRHPARGTDELSPDGVDDAAVIYGRDTLKIHGFLIWWRRQAVRTLFITQGECEWRGLEPPWARRSRSGCRERVYCSTSSTWSTFSTPAGATGIQYGDPFTSVEVLIVY